MALGIIGTVLAGAASGAGEAGVKAGLELQKQFGSEELQRLRQFGAEELQRLRSESDRSLAVTLEGIRTTNRRGEYDYARTRDVQAAREMLPIEEQKKRTDAGIDIDAAMRKPRTLAPGASEVVGGEVRVTAPQKDLDPSQVSVNQAHAAYYNAMAKKAREMGLNDTQSTALISNVNFLVRSGIAADPKEAFDRLRTGMAKPEDSQVLDVTKMLLKDRRYRGPTGLQDAAKDARGMVQSMRGDDDSELGAPAARSRNYILGGKAFNDVDLEFTAQKHGLTVEQVKRRLGIN